MKAALLATVAIALAMPAYATLAGDPRRGPAGAAGCAAASGRCPAGVTATLALARSHLGDAAILVLILVLGGCATRRLESCFTTVMMLGPGTFTIDCRPAVLPPQ